MGLPNIIPKANNCTAILIIGTAIGNGGSVGIASNNDFSILGDKIRSGGDEGDLPEGDLSSVTFRLKSQIWDFNHAFSHEDRPGKNPVRDEDQSLTNNSLGKDARDSTPEVVMRMLSVVSSPQLSCQMPVMK